MKNTKTKIVLLLLLVILSILPVAIAEEPAQTTTNENTLDPETEAQINTITTQFGAEVRLLQLEKSISYNILWGQEIVKLILEKNASADVARANKILDEMTLLLDEVRATPTTGTAEELAQIFVDLKNDAVNLTQEFRQSTKDLLSPTDRATVKERLKNMQKSELDKLNQAIQDARNEYNADQLESILSALGITNPELVQKVRDGTATNNEIKDTLKNQFANLTTEQKKDVLLKIKEFPLKRIIYKRAAVLKIFVNKLERKSTRWENRAEKFQNMSLVAALKNQTIRSKVFEKISNRAEIRSQHLLEQAEQLRERIQNRIITRKNNSDEKVCEEGKWWCPATKECINRGTLCIDPKRPEGGDIDEHGCKPSTGASWCESTQKCIRAWETKCPPLVQDNAGAQGNSLGNQGG